MKVLIIEDEFHAAERLQQLLDKVRPDFEVLEVIDSVEDALEWFAANEKPNLIFMDIQLADGLSFEILEKTDLKVPLIFITAFHQYTLEAFKTHSIDYLLKPIDEKQLKTAIDKWESLKSMFQSNWDKRLLSDLMMQLSGATKSYRTSFLVKQQQVFVPVNVKDIQFCHSEDGITLLNSCTGKRWIVDYSLDQLETELDPSIFFRINRKQIIKRTSITKVHPYFNHRYKLEMDTKQRTDFIVARKRAKAFKEWMDG